MTLRRVLGMTLIAYLIVFASASAGFAGTRYSCHVIGDFKNIDGVIANVDKENIEVVVNAPPAEFGRLQEPQHDFDTRWEAKWWTLRLSETIDADEPQLELSLSAPNQAGRVGAARAERGSKYIGFIFNSQLEALCKKSK
jgi:acylphosphatase